MARTMKELAVQVLSVQNASNINVVHAFSESLKDLRELLPKASSRDVNRHPIMQLWASKVHDLAGLGMSDAEEFGKAYEAVQELAK